MADLDLDRMKEVAKAATPGPWNRDGHHMSRVLRCTAERETTEAKHLCGDFIEVADAGENWMVDAPFIATFDPPTVLALIDRLEVAEAQRDLWEDERNKWAGEAIARMDDARTLRAGIAEAVEALKAALAVIDVDSDEENEWASEVYEQGRAIVAKHKEPSHG